MYITAYEKLFQIPRDIRWEEEWELGKKGGKGGKKKKKEAVKECGKGE